MLGVLLASASPLTAVGVEGLPLLGVLLGALLGALSATWPVCVCHLNRELNVPTKAHTYA